MKEGRGRGARRDDRKEGREGRGDKRENCSG